MVERTLMPIAVYDIRMDSERAPSRRIEAKIGASVGYGSHRVVESRVKNVDHLFN